MIGHIFYWIINMNLVAALIGLPVWLITHMKFIPRRIAVFFWLPPFVHMVLPVGIAGKFSYLSFLSRFFTRTLVINNEEDILLLSATNVLSMATKYNPVTFSTQLLDIFFQVGGIIWLLIAIILMSIVTYYYHNTFFGLKNARLLYDNVYESDKTLVPCVIGIMCPRIVLPVGYPEKNIKYVLDHEIMHIRWKDNLWRLLSLYIVIINWFNPLGWLMLKKLHNDIELACDERVIKRYNDHERKEYATALLEGIQQRTAYYSAFTGEGVRGRIMNIIEYRRMSVLATVCSLIFALSIIVFLMGYAK